MPKFNVADKPTLDELYNRMLHKGQYVGVEVNINQPYKLPYNFYNGTAVVWNDEIHIMGSGYAAAPDIATSQHWKFDGNEWKPVSTIPFIFTHGSAVVYNNEIHILGGSSSLRYHYKWNGAKWVSVSTLPNISFQRGDVVVWNGSLRILGSSNSSYYAYSYIYNDKTATWNRTTNTPFNFYDGSVVLYDDNMLYILGGSGNNTAFRRCTGLRWETITDSAGTAIVIPFKYLNGAVLNYHGKIHVLGSSSAAATYLYHYVWDGTAWTRLNDLPYNFINGNAVVYRDEIHILGSSQAVTVYQCHYKYIEETDTWTNNNVVTTLKEIPIAAYRGSIIKYNDEIHLLGSSHSMYYKSHYSYNYRNNTWKSVSTLPYNFYYGSAVKLNDEIHILGGNNSADAHYKYSPTTNTWTSVSILPYRFIGGIALILNNEIHILGGYNTTSHYKWNGSAWVSVSTLPYELYYGNAIVLNNEIHILGTDENTTDYKKHYKYSPATNTWTSVSTLPYAFTYGSAVVYNNEIHIFSTKYDSSKYTSHYKWNGSAWVSVSTLPYELYYGYAIVLNNELYILGGYSLTTNQPQLKHYKYNGITWDKTAPFITYTEYFLPENCLIRCDSENTMVNGKVYYDTNLQSYIVKSTGSIKIQALNDKGHLYNIL